MESSIVIGYGVLILVCPRPVLTRGVSSELLRQEWSRWDDMTPSAYVALPPVWLEVVAVYCSGSSLLKVWSWWDDVTPSFLVALPPILSEVLTAEAAAYWKSGHGEMMHTFSFSCPPSSMSGGFRGELLRQQLTEEVVALRWSDPFSFCLSFFQLSWWNCWETSILEGLVVVRWCDPLTFCCSPSIFWRC